MGQRSHVFAKLMLSFCSAGHNCARPMFFVLVLQHGFAEAEEVSILLVDLHLHSHACEKNNLFSNAVFNPEKLMLVLLAAASICGGNVPLGTRRYGDADTCSFKVRSASFVMTGAKTTMLGELG